MAVTQTASKRKSMRKSEVVAPEAEGAPTKEVEADPTIGTSTPDSPDRVLEVVGNDTNRMVDALVEMGDDPKVAKRKLTASGMAVIHRQKLNRESICVSGEQVVARDTCSWFWIICSAAWMMCSQ